MAKQVTIATAADAIQLATRLKGQFATITMRTEQKGNIRAANRIHLPADLVKISKVSVQCGVRYANVVEAQRKREGVEQDEAFKAQKTWGEPIEGSPLVRYGAGIYLACKLVKSIESHFEDGSGNELADADVYPHLYKRNQAKTQQTEKEIRWMKPKIESIMSIAAFGEVYVIAEHIQLTKHLITITQ